MGTQYKWLGDFEEDRKSRVQREDALSILEAMVLSTLAHVAILKMTADARVHPKDSHKAADQSINHAFPIYWLGQNHAARQFWHARLTPFTCSHRSQATQARLPHLPRPDTKDEALLTKMRQLGSDDSSEAPTGSAIRRAAGAALADPSGLSGQAHNYEAARAGIMIHT
jgi:hypothetical protein